MLITLSNVEVVVSMAVASKTNEFFVLRAVKADRQSGAFYCNTLKMCVPYLSFLNHEIATVGRRIFQPPSDKYRATD